MYKKIMGRGSNKSVEVEFAQKERQLIAMCTRVRLLREDLAEAERGKDIIGAAYNMLYEYRYPITI